MLGPKIVRHEAPERPAGKPRHQRGETGIRQDNTGSWAAIRDGKLAGTFTGSGARRLAIREAGTNTVLS